MATKKTATPARRKTSPRSNVRVGTTNLTNYKRVSSRRATLFAVALAIIGVAGLVYSFAATPGKTLEAEEFSYNIRPDLIAPPTATQASMWFAATGTKSVNFGDKMIQLSVVARSNSCNGDPIMEVKVDDVSVLKTSVASRTYATYDTGVSIAPGAHTVTVSFLNDYYVPKTATNPGCDRNLFVDKLQFNGQTFTETATSGTVTNLALVGRSEGESFAFGAMGKPVGSYGLMWSGGTVQSTVTLSRAVDTVSVTAWGSQCEGVPQMVVSVDNKQILSKELSNATPNDFTVKTPIAAGTHTLKVSFLNDYKQSDCDRNIYIDKIDFLAPPVPIQPLLAINTGVAPGAKQVTKLYVDTKKPPYLLTYDASQATWRAQNPTYVPLIKKIADQPQGIWLGYSSDDTVMTTALSGAATTGASPVFVLYNIPNRDNGQYASGGGGAATATAYKQWIDFIAAKLGDSTAVIILEPDTVPMGVTGQYRLESMQYAITKLGALKNVRVYVDAGNSSWGHSPEKIADRLRQVGIDKAKGFSLNVANFNNTQNEVAYGQKISALVGNKPFVVDTSRNGNGSRPKPTDGSSVPSEYYWCNPPGRALGSRPSLNTGIAKVDAFLWIKAPGEVDGPCNGAVKNLGNFWIAYALELSRNASY